MKQLSGLDATFLYMETPTTYGHVNGLSIYERPSADFDPYRRSMNGSLHWSAISNRSVVGSSTCRHVGRGHRFHLARGCNRCSPSRRSNVGSREIAGQRRDLQCSRPAPSLVLRGGQARPLHSGVDDFEPHGAQITVHSYEDRLDFGLVADRELVPHLWDMVDLHIDEVKALFDATGAKWAVPQQPAAPRRGAMTAP